MTAAGGLAAGARVVDGPAEPSLQDGLHAQLVLEAAREAAARRAWVDVPTLSA